MSPPLDRDVAQALLGLAGQVTLRGDDPDFEHKAEVLMRARRQLLALIGDSTEVA